MLLESFQLMPLSAGERLGPYEILSPLGAGGMGEVYKARDTRLDRIVAIKVSQAQFSERFENEARAVAALNHPHICQLYDVGPDYLVMEFVEGAPLKGPLPIEKAVEFAGQILDALDAAHQKGITHRDLKPDNILVTKKGIKLLDFGLAKRSGPLKESDATLTQALTQQGAIIGTLNYMSPEQLQSKQADARSDIFSFGLVLYEMLTGKRTFEASSAASVIAAILERPAPSLAGVGPPALDRLLRRALAKQPEDRWQSARDLKHAIEDLDLAPPSKPSPARRWWPLAIGAVALLAVAAVALMDRGAAPAETYALSISAPPGVTFEFNVGRGGIAISPDGRTVAFAAQDTLWVRPLGAREARKLPGTDRAYYPFFSPDGKSVAYFAPNRLMKVELVSGAITEVAGIDAGTMSARGGTWNESGTILFALLNQGSIYRVSSSGGLPEPITTPDPARGNGSHYFPHFLPDGDHFFYGVKSREAAANGIFASSLKDPHVNVRVTGAFSNMTFVPPAVGRSGYVLYCRDGNLLAQPFDPSTLRTTGDPSVLGQPGVLPNQSMANFASSRNGTVVVGSAGAEKLQVAWLDTSGRKISTLGSVDHFIGPRISPDGSRVTSMRYAFGEVGGGVVIDLVRGTTVDLGPSTYPFWSPDGKSVIYFQQGKIFRKDSDSVAPPTPLAELQGPVLSGGDISPGGNYVAVRDARGLIALPVGQTTLPPITFGDGTNPRFSPDGRYIAYAGATKPGIYVEKFPERTFRTVVANAGSEVIWPRDGKRLYYRSPQGRTVWVDIHESANGISFGSPHEAFDSPEKDAVIRGLDVSPDGKRFLVLLAEETAHADTELTVLLNWREALKK